MVSAQALLWGTDQGQSQHGGVFCVVVLYWKIFEQYNAFGEAAALNFFFSSVEVFSEQDCLEKVNVLRAGGLVQNVGETQKHPLLYHYRTN
jgi:hypothetical protein